MATHEHVETFKWFVTRNQERRARGGLQDVNEGGRERGDDVEGEAEIGEGDSLCVCLRDERSGR